MSGLLSGGLDWLGRHTGWSTTRESWAERLGVLAGLAGVLVLFFYGSALPGPLVVLLAGGLAGWGAYTFRRGWLRLLGPVFFYDAVRLARQRRQLWLRAGYAALLGLVLAWAYGVWYYEEVGYRGGVISLREAARFASGYFEAFVIIQGVAIVLLTPAYVGGAVADEKERKTLEFLLATDLRNREIIFGKLAARVGTLGLFVLAGLPVLSLVQFCGGVDPERLLAAFAATFALLLSLSATSIFASVVARRGRDALALAYLVPLAYFAISLMAQGLRALPTMGVPVTVLGRTFTGVDVLYALTCGNPAIGLIELEQAAFGGGASGRLLYSLLGDFVLFHAAATALCLAYAVWRVRAIALRQSYGSVPRARAREARRRPQPGDEPMFWKEVFVEAGLRMNVVGKVVLLAIVVLSLTPPALIFWNYFIEPFGTGRVHGAWWSPDLWERFGEAMQVWVRVAGTVVACLLLLAVGVRGAGAVSGERDRQTLDSLLTTTLSAPRILWGKWWGAVLGVRAGWTWLATVWLLGLASGGVHIAAVPIFALAMVVFAGAFAWLGIWFSVTCRTTLRATLATILTALFLGGGYIFFGFLCCISPLEAVVGHLDRSAERTLVSLLCGFSPAVVVGWLPFRTFNSDEIELIHHQESFVAFAVFGLAAWGGLSVLLSQFALRRFRQLANRPPVRPARRPPGVHEAG